MEPIIWYIVFWIPFLFGLPAYAFYYHMKNSLGQKVSFLKCLGISFIAIGSASALSVVAYFLFRDFKLFPHPILAGAIVFFLTGVPIIILFLREIRLAYRINAGLTMTGLAFLLLALAVFSMGLYESPHHWNQVFCESALKQIGLACDMYSQGYGGHLPDKGLQQTYPDFVADPRVFTCPAVERERRNRSTSGTRNPHNH